MYVLKNFSMRLEAPKDKDYALPISVAPAPWLHEIKVSIHIFTKKKTTRVWIISSKINISGWCLYSWDAQGMKKKKKSIWYGLTLIQIKKSKMVIREGRKEMGLNPKIKRQPVLLWGLFWKHKFDPTLLMCILEGYSGHKQFSYLFLRDFVCYQH